MRTQTKIAWALLAAAGASELAGIWFWSDRWALTGAVFFAAAYIAAMYAIATR